MVTPYTYGVRLGLFPGGIDARDVTQPDTVEYFRFLDRPGGERFVLALEGPKSDRIRSFLVRLGRRINTNMQKNISSIKQVRENAKMAS